MAPEIYMNHLPPETDMWQFRHLLVYARSALTEQTTPESMELNDTIASVSDLEFAGKDLDVGQLGGVMTWQPPPDARQILT